MALWRCRWIGIVWLVAWCVAAAPAGRAWAEAGRNDRDQASGSVDFIRDVQPILSNHCYACHGPDPEDRQAGLRLDTREGALAETELGSRAIVPGDLEASEIYWRIFSEDNFDVMPPPETGKPLSQDQKTILSRWIEQGGEYAQHWAFVPPDRPEVPEPVRSTGSWARNPIDHFVAERLEAKGLQPSSEADRVTLIRRLYLDLVGLPPTPEELQEARAIDQETLVDRLLDSPHYGEHWGRFWLDAARYADSDGFEKDKPRTVWFYRDYVINALNQDLPYDQFVTEQIAGDLLPGASQAQRVATGYLRNSMVNEEGGVDPEQFRMAAMFDRMDAIGRGVLGLTIQCAQCHTHKYDPLTHSEYYQMFALLNNAHEAAITVHTPTQREQIAGIEAVVASIEEGLKDSLPDWPARMTAWEQRVAQRSEDQPDWRVITPEPIDITTNGQKFRPLPDGSLVAGGYSPVKNNSQFVLEIPGDEPIAAIRYQVLTHPDFPHGGPGRSVLGTCALTEFQVSAAPLDDTAAGRRVKIASATASINPPETPLSDLFYDKTDKKRVTGPIAMALDGQDTTAWGIDVGPARRNRSREAVFVLEEPVQFDGGTRLTVTLVQRHGGWNNNANESHNVGRFRLAVSSDAKAEANPIPDEVRAILAMAPEERTEAQTARVFGFWRTTVEAWSEANRRIASLESAYPEGTTQLAMVERRGEPRATHRLERGEFLQPAERVEPGVPEFLNPWPTGQPLDRLGLARWLTDRRAPTTARAIVNRVWQSYFGVGLIDTPEDLGLQGARPSHPELLDWLAVEFMEGGWSFKHLHRLIVNSATYRQSSRTTPELQEVDPNNRLLARGPRFRLDAEVIRDVALRASGLLDDRLGGPSVYPPAPRFLFLPPESYGTKIWDLAEDPTGYRRALYTFRYRSVPYPALDAFDAPKAEVSCVRRERSNTPLQALVTLNESVSMQCARSLARLVLDEAGMTDRDRLQLAFQRCLSRGPSQRELEILESMFASQLDRYTDPEADLDAWQLAALNPQDPRPLPEGETPERLAALTAVARVLLNLDETLTKE